MTTTSAVLIASKRVENVQTTQYTSTGKKTIVDKFTVTNTSVAAVTFSCNVVPSGVTLSDANLIVQAHSIAPGACYECPELVGRRLDAGDYLSTLASAADALTMRAEGRQLT